MHKIAQTKSAWVRSTVAESTDMNGLIDAAAIRGPCRGAGNFARSRLSAGWTRKNAGPQPE
jgi:hypothetical protein